MRTFVLLSLIALAAADGDMGKQGDCMIDGGAAVSDAIDGAMFIWASIERCGKDNLEIKCEIAITSAIEAVNTMINVIVKAVDKCGHVTSARKECGMAAGTLTKSVAGLAASTGGIVQKCPNSFAHQAHSPAWTQAGSVTCVVDLKKVFTSLFKAIKALMRIKKLNENCQAPGADTMQCISNDLTIVAALSGLGEFLAGAIGHCTNSKNNDDVECAEQIGRLIKDVTKVSRNGMDVSRKCKVAAPAAPMVVEVQAPEILPPVLPPARLFTQTDQTEAAQTPTISANLLLGAFLPVTAIVSFVGGRFYGNRNSEAREVMSDNE